MSNQKQQIGHHNHFSNLNQIQLPCPRSLIIPSIIRDLCIQADTFNLNAPCFTSKQLRQAYLLSLLKCIKIHEPPQQYDNVHSEHKLS